VDPSHTLIGLPSSRFGSQDNDPFHCFPFFEVFLARVVTFTDTSESLSANCER
jgi:hypothetical protein